MPVAAVDGGGGGRAGIGGDVLLGLPAILTVYAAALRAARARFAAGKEAAAAASATRNAARAQVAAVAATSTVGDDPALAQRRLVAGAALDRAAEDGAAADSEMDAAIADEQVAHQIAATAVGALSAQMAAMRTTIAAPVAARSPDAAGWGEPARTSTGGPGRPALHGGVDARGDVLPARTDAEVAAGSGQGGGALDAAQDALGLAGLIPAVGIVPDAVNTAVYAARGDWSHAALSGVAMVPVVGVAGFAGRAALKARRAATLAKVADADARKAAETAEGAAAARAARATEVGHDGLTGPSRLAMAERRAHLADTLRTDAVNGSVTRFASPASSKPPDWPAAVADRPTSGGLWTFPPRAPPRRRSWGPRTTPRPPGPPGRRAGSVLRVASARRTRRTRPS